MELQELPRLRMLVTVESLRAELEAARALAMKCENGASAAVAGTLGKAKLHGLLIEKKELAGKAGAPISREVVHKLDDASARKIADLVRWQHPPEEAFAVKFARACGTCQLRGV